MVFSKSKIFLFCLLSFVLGVGLSSFWLLDLIYIYSLLLAVIVAIFFIWQNWLWRAVGLCVLFFLLGVLRFSLSLPDKNNPAHISYYNGQKVEIQAVVAEEPDVRLDGQKLTVESKFLNTRTTPGPSSERRGFLEGRLLIKAPLYPQYEYGDLLKINCQIQAPEQIENFAYDKYLARYDIYSVCWRGQIEKIGSDQGNVIKAVLIAIKTQFLQAINNSLPEPHSSLLAGILIGARRGIPEYLLEAFNRVGVTHIIAISGSNITIIAAVLISLVQLLSLPRRYNFWLISLVIGLFVVMTGASASVVRAGVMGVFVLLARELGRASRATNALVFTAFCMLLINPKILIFDAGFQLSFLATMGLVYINPLLQNYAKRWGEWLGIKEILVTTLSAIIMTTPLILYQFGRFSLVAPLANILIVPLVPLVMAVGFVAGLAGLISTSLGQIFGWGAWLLLQYIISVAEWLSHWSWASLELGGFHWVLMVAMYGLLAWGIFRLTFLSSPRKRGSINNQRTGFPPARE